MKEYKLALVGNPNSGKTTLFNSLSGARQKVGNWPGVTVEAAKGSIQGKEEKVEIIDLPGTYDLQPDSDDQKVAEAFVKHGNFDCIVNVVDASSLSRNLYLTLKLLNETTHLLVLLNMMDVAEKEGLLIDYYKLSEQLGVPVIPVVSIDPVSVGKARIRILEHLRNPPVSERRAEKQKDPEELYKLIDRICDQCINTLDSVDSMTEKIDRIVLNRYGAIPIFVFVMYTVFWFAIGVGSVFIDFFEQISGLFVAIAEWGLQAAHVPGWFIHRIFGGLGTGIQTVATFIPIVFCLFLAIGFLEDLGYLARIGVISDIFLKKIGLPGNAFLPLIIGLGCTVPAIMACRTLKSRKDRYMTIFLSPFMSCGARIPVYALFANALYPDFPGLIVFSLYGAGIFMAILSGLFLKRTIFKGESTGFILELPLYHLPRPAPIFRNASNRTGWFIKRAGKVLVAAIFILTLLDAVSLNNQDNLGISQSGDESLLTWLGKSIHPVFSPMGITEENWPATVALFSGLFAKEAIVGTVNALYSQKSHEEKESSSRESGRIQFVKTELEDAFLSLGNSFLGLFQGGDILGIRMIQQERAALQDELETDPEVFAEISSHFTPFSGYAYLLFVLLYFPCLAAVGAAKQEMGSLYAFFMVLYSTVLAWSVATFFYQITEGGHIGLMLLPAGIMILLFLAMANVGARPENRRKLT